MNFTQLEHSGKLLIGVPTGKGIVHIPAEVRHSLAFGATGMELGCEFAAPLPTGNPLPEPPPIASRLLQEVHVAVKEILENCQAKQLPSHERRVHPRVIFNERVTIHIEKHSESIVCYARDLSKGGMSFIAQEKLPAEITVEIASAGTRPALKLRCKVVRCSRIEDGFYDIGAAFMRMDDKMKVENVNPDANDR